MLAVSAFYLIVSSILFLKKPLNLNLNTIQIKIYKSMFIIGILNFIIWIISLIIPWEYWIAISSLPVLITSLYVIKIIKEWQISLEVMNKLDK